MKFHKDIKYYQTIRKKELLLVILRTLLWTYSSLYISRSFNNSASYWDIFEKLGTKISMIWHSATIKNHNLTYILTELWPFVIFKLTIKISGAILSISYFLKFDAETNLLKCYKNNVVKCLAAKNRQCKHRLN